MTILLRRFSVLACFLFIIIVLWGYSDTRELTRAKAKSIIQSSAKFSPAAVVPVLLSRAGIECGLSQGYWTKNNWGNLGVTPKGKPFFQDMNAGMQGTGYGTLAGQHKRKVIEVTGITSHAPAQNMTIVQITWQWTWDDVPAEARKCVGEAPPPKNADVLLQLYDDGWRVVQINN